MPDTPKPDVYDLYAAAAEITDPARQDSFLQESCEQDLNLLQQLRDMLSMRQQANDLFDNAGLFGGGLSGGQLGLSKVGRFRLERLEGRGGMGNVFLAHDEELDRPVALKFPRVDMMANPELRNRFLREARLAAQLSHPNLVDIYEVGAWGQSCYIASRWCEGGDLANWLLEHPGPQDSRWAATLIRSISRAVAYCHQQGVVHLDIKPANIILSPDPEGQTGELRPMLTDFGVARVIEEGLNNTQSSLLLGTPLYMAPEQAECRRDKIGPGSDVFALGVILYELLYGKRPFEGESAMEVLDQIRASETLAIPVRGVPRDLRTICQRCLQRDLKCRYPSADALAEDLDRFLRGEPIHARPVSYSQRLGRWLLQPVRMAQAGMIAIGFQSLLMLNFASSLIVMRMGWLLPIHVGFDVVLRETAFLAFCLHGPSLVLAYLAVQMRWWAVPLGCGVTVLTVIAMCISLSGNEPALSYYDQNPLAKFLIHLMWLGAMVVQLAAYLLALPAAIARIRSVQYHR